MKGAPEVIILDSSPEAAREVTVTGWVSRTGHFYGKDERMARWDGATHLTCECGTVFKKGHIRCDSCQAKRDREKWEAMEAKQWDSEEPVCFQDGDKYFWSLDDFLDWCDGAGVDPKEQQLVFAKPTHLHQVDPDYWCDDLPEDDELPDEVAQALKEFNRVIEKQGPASWWPSAVRVILPELDAAP